MSVCMDKISQSKNELENIKILLDRKSKEIEIIKQISNQINKSLNLNLIASSMLSLMNEFFGFKHSMILLVSENKKYLNVLETFGYEKKGIGAKVEFGVGVIGIVAEKKKLMRMANLGMQRSYMQAIREQVKITNKNNYSSKPNSNEPKKNSHDKFWCSPLPKGKNYKRFVDFQNDVAVSDIEVALREGYRSIEHVKRYTTLGMATDQGRTSNLNGLQLVANVEKKLFLK